VDNTWIFLLVGLAAIAFFIYQWYANAQRRQELLAWGLARGLTFDPSERDGFDSQFAAFECLQKGENQYAHNILEGDWHGRKILAFDYHYETESHDSKGGTTHESHEFSAVILFSPTPLEPLAIRPEGFFDKVTEFFGKEDINFESAEFSRKFYVTAPDKKWAYDVLHQRTMEFLLGSPVFNIQFTWNCAIAYDDSTFDSKDFQAAAEVLQGILDRLPDYLVQQQKQNYFNGNKEKSHG
jgi:hypothetical protein